MKGFWAGSCIWALVLDRSLYSNNELEPFFNGLFFSWYASVYVVNRRHGDKYSLLLPLNVPTHNCSRRQTSLRMRNWKARARDANINAVAPSIFLFLLIAFFAKANYLPVLTRCSVAFILQSALSPAMTRGREVIRGRLWIRKGKTSKVRWLLFVFTLYKNGVAWSLLYMFTDCVYVCVATYYFESVEC